MAAHSCKPDHLAVGAQTHHFSSAKKSSLSTNTTFQPSGSVVAMILVPCEHRRNVMNSLVPSSIPTNKLG